MTRLQPAIKQSNDGAFHAKIDSYDERALEPLAVGYLAQQQLAS